MNLAIIKKNSNEIGYFILDCIKVSDKEYIGSNVKLGIKPTHWKFVWTNDMLAYDENKKEWSKKADEIIPVPIFMGQHAGSKADINKIIVDEIRKKYTIDDEMQMARIKESNPDEWAKYNEYVESIITSGKQFKDLYFNG